MSNTEAGVATRILSWLRAGYPQGIPPKDYVPLLDVLRRKLTDDDITAIAHDLAEQSAKTGEPVSGEAIQSMIKERAFQNATPQDIVRVCAHLAAGGWPLSTDFE